MYRILVYVTISPGSNREIWFHHDLHYFFFAFFTGSISTMNWWSSSGKRCL